MTTPEMEIALAHFFNYRRNLVVPNISWGLDLHECDLLVLTGRNYAWEVEIKVSKADLIADKKKYHQHYSHKIQKLFFAIPEKLKPFVEHIPERAGIIVVYSNRRCELIRQPIRNGNFRFTFDDRYHMASLACLRIWGLKETIERFKREKRTNGGRRD